MRLASEGFFFFFFEQSQIIMISITTIIIRASTFGQATLENRDFLSISCRGKKWIGNRPKMWPGVIMLVFYGGGGLLTEILIAHFQVENVKKMPISWDVLWDPFQLCLKCFDSIKLIDVWTTKLISPVQSFVLFEFLKYLVKRGTLFVERGRN